MGIADFIPWMDPAPPESCQSAQYQSDVATTRNNLGNLLSAMGQYEEAKALYAQALAMRETLLASDKDNAQYPFFGDSIKG